MRDYLVFAIVLAAAAMALRRPWIGILLWTWVSLLNPHRFCYGFAYDAPIAAIAAGSTLIGLLITKDRESPFKGAPPVILALFIVWITISWLMGLSPDQDYWQWNKVMKILLMVMLGLALMRTKVQILAYTWVVAGSLALLGSKGGLFTLMSGGGDRVYGPPGSFIEENNSLGLALITTIPLLRFLQMQLRSKIGINIMTVTMILVAASALGSHSRGALLAISAMGLMLWWRGKSKLMGGVVIVALAVALVAFMPDNWANRMSTLNDEEQDNSVLGRYSAWWVSWGIAKNYFFGVGFDISRPELFAAYSPYPHLGTPAAHSIYFQILGHHGFVGLALYLAFWASVWRMSTRVRAAALRIPEARWCGEMASMAQVALFGFFVGGSFLSLAYFDLPYNVMVILVLTERWLASKAWLTEPAYQPKRWWARIPGLHSASVSK